MTVDQATHAELVRRYFDMWNVGDGALARGLLAPTWQDHAHPQVTGPDDLAEAVVDTRERHPHLHFRIDTVLADGDLVAAFGAVSGVIDPDPALDGQRVGAGGPDDSAFIWLFKLDTGRLAELWTYPQLPT